LTGVNTVSCTISKAFLTVNLGFFADRPELGETFIRYMETEDRTLIKNDMFAFITMNETDNYGFVVLDPDLVPVLTT
jgi:hypothetical protein